MSVVTNVVLVTGLVDKARVEEINGWLYEQGMGSVVKADQYAGGSKAMEVDVYLGAFNYLDELAFGDFCVAQPWEWPQDFCLLTQTEDYPRRVWYRNTDGTQAVVEAAES